MASRSLGYGRSANIAVCTTAMTSPPSAPIMVKPRIRSSLPATRAFMNPCVSSVVSVRRTALVASLGTRLGRRPSEVCRLVESLRGRVTPHAAHAPSVGRGCAPRRRSGQSISCRGRPLSRETTRAPGNVAPPACVTACDHVLRDGVPHRDLDPEHFAPRARLRILVAKSTRGMPHSGPLTGYL